MKSSRFRKASKTHEEVTVGMKEAGSVQVDGWLLPQKEGSLSTHVAVHYATGTTRRRAFRTASGTSPGETSCSAAVSSAHAVSGSCSCSLMNARMGYSTACTCELCVEQRLVTHKKRISRSAAERAHDHFQRWIAASQPAFAPLDQVDGLLMLVCFRLSSRLSLSVLTFVP